MANDMIFLQISILPIDVIILIYIKIKYGGTNRISPYFTAFALQVALGTALDSIVGFIDSLHDADLGTLLMVLTALDHFTGQSVTYSFQRYATNFIGSEKYRRGRVEKLTKVLAAVYPALLVGNFFFHYAYTYENGIYIRKALWFPVVFIIPCIHLFVEFPPGAAGHPLFGLCYLLCLHVHPDCLFPEYPADILHGLPGPSALPADI